MTRNKPNSPKRNVTLSVLSVLFVLLVLETGLRSYDAFRGRGFFSSYWNRVKYETAPIPFRTFGVRIYRRNRGALFVSSSHGELYPFKKACGTFRIVCLGGSTTQNRNRFSPPNRPHYPALLEAILKRRLGTEKIEVINLGWAAYCTVHSLILLELDVVSMNPDLVIVSHNTNDLVIAYYPGVLPDYSNRYSQPGVQVPDLRNHGLLDHLLQHFRLYWTVKRRLRLSRPTAPVRWKSYGERPNAMASQVFQRNLRSLIAIAKENRIRILLATQALCSKRQYYLRSIRHKRTSATILWPPHDEFVKHHGL